MKLGRPSGTKEKWRRGSGAVLSRSLSQRFWEKVDIKGDDECWEWKAFVHPSGYGNLALNKKMVGAHRISWELTYGEIPDGLWVLHTCDNRKCVNPHHLFLGDRQDNTDDREKKGRNKIPNNAGSNHGMSKLTEDKVEYILSSDDSTQLLADLFGVSITTIKNIRHGDTWKHVIRKDNVQ